jgi:23S rRNA (cytidine1920-2'-O)/16S rRNA (cytidine1409-2'-O)-methyltransferase
MAGSRGDARRAIEESRVRVDGVAEPRPATLVDPATAVRLVDPGPGWAGRGAYKLEAALDAFEVPVAGRTALDVGASTGGFTDVLLSRGAARVAAVDVGYGQMVWRLAQDPRVDVFDRTNFRHADVDALGAPFGVVTVDVSFISVGLLAERLSAAGRPDTDYVVLVKPQFEVGKGSVGRGGIVTDPALHLSAVEGVASALDGVGIGALAVIPSPLRGSKGNREFLLHARFGDRRDLSTEEITAP